MRARIDRFPVLEVFLAETHGREHPFVQIACVHAPFVSVDLPAESQARLPMVAAVKDDVVAPSAPEELNLIFGIRLELGISCCSAYRAHYAIYLNIGGKRLGVVK